MVGCVLFTWSAVEFSGICGCRGSTMDFLLSEAAVLRVDLEQELKTHQHQRASSL